MPSSTPSAAGPRAAAAVALVAMVALLAALLPTAASAQPESRRIGDADDPVAAAIRMSQDTIADGDAEVAVIGRVDRFPDNLAGAAATQADGPLLLTDPAPAPVRDDVLDEVQRVLGAPSGEDCEGRPADVLILGGDLAIGADAESQVEALGYCPVRLGGSERVGTSVAVASYLLGLFLTPESSRGTLLIATADNPADSASSSAWAARFGYPIVVTDGEQLDSQVAELLTPGDTQWDEVILLGGDLALSQQVEDQVAEALQPGVTTIRRVAGVTRDDTAFVAATELWGPDRQGAAIVEGFAEDFWTAALPGAAVAGRADVPLLYTNAGLDRVPDPTDVYLRQTPLSYLLTIGSQARISPAIQQAAEDSLGSGAEPDPDPPAGDDLVLLDDGVLYDQDGQALTPGSSRVTAFDIDMGGDIALAVDGELFCLCGGQGEENLVALTDAPGSSYDCDDAPVLTEAV